MSRVLKVFTGSVKKASLAFTINIAPDALFCSAPFPSELSGAGFLVATAHSCDGLPRMTSVTFSKFVNSPRLRQAVKAGKSFLVTENGQPCFRVLPPENTATHEGEGRHLFKGQAVSPERIPGAEWGDKE